MVLGVTRGAPSGDIVQPFRIETQAVRGKLVRLGATVDRIVSHQDYPLPVATLLGELAVLAALVGSTLKVAGILTVQIKGAGAIGMLVADATSDGAIRGYAQYDPDALSESTGRSDWRLAPVPRLIGAGHLAFTLDQGPDNERHQGIAELCGGSLAECAHSHFRRSDQSQADFKLAVSPGGGGNPWRAGGMMIERLPDPGPARVSGAARDEAAEEDWCRAVILMGSCTPEELVDDRLHPHDLLYRLFHEDGVRVSEPLALAHGCRCSRDRVVMMLRSFPRGEIEALRIDDVVIVTCEFCGARYDFDDAALEGVYQTH